MKKLRLNKIFHWLYALLMFLPFIMLVGFIILTFGKGEFTSDEWIATYERLNQVLVGFVPADFMEGSLLEPVENAIESVFDMFFGFNVTDNTFIGTGVYCLLVYWVEISFVYLMFDVVMYPINLFHKWIDDGGF